MLGIGSLKLYVHRSNEGPIQTATVGRWMDKKQLQFGRQEKRKVTELGE